MFAQYKKTGYIWEQYDDVTGAGKVRPSNVMGKVLLYQGVISLKISHFQPPSHMDPFRFCSHCFYMLTLQPIETYPNYMPQITIVKKI